MRIGFQSDVPDSCQQLFESRIPRQVRSEEQNIDQTSNQGLGFTSIAVSNPRTDDDVLLPCVPMEEQLKDSQQSHKQGRFLTATERLYLPAQLTRKGKIFIGPPEGLDRWSRAVRGQIQTARQ